MVEHSLLALVACRAGEVRDVKTKGKTEKMTVGKKLQWDGKSLKAKGCPEADKFITKTYRKGWVLNG